MMHERRNAVTTQETAPVEMQCGHVKTLTPEAAKQARRNGYLFCADCQCKQEVKQS